MTQTFEDAGKFGKEFLDTGLTSFTAVTRDAQAISSEASDYSKTAFETGSGCLAEIDVGEVDREGDRDPDRLRQAGL